MPIRYLDSSGALAAWHFIDQLDSNDSSLYPSFALVSGTTYFGDIWPGLRGLFLPVGTVYRCPAAPALYLNSSLSVEMLVVPATTTTNLGGGILTKLVNWRAQVFYATSSDYCQPRFSGRAVVSDSEGAGITAPTNVRLGQPTYIAMTRVLTGQPSANVNTGIYSVYVNGVLWATSGNLQFPTVAYTLTSFPPSSTNVEKLTIDCTATSVEIGLASLQIKNYAMTDAEVQANYDYCLGDVYPRRSV